MIPRLPRQLSSNRLANQISSRRIERDYLTLLRRRGGFDPRYINLATGSDANDGRTPATAWATAAPANTALAVANNGITHLRIDTSAAPLILATGINLGANARGITIESATPGVKADIRCYKTLSNAAFTQPDVGTYPNVWSTTDTQARSVLWERGGSNAYDLIWYTHPLGANFAAVASTLNTTPGSFWTDGTTMYFRPLTGNDPVGDGKEYVRSYIYAASHPVLVQTRATIQNLMVGGSCLAGAASINDISGGASPITLTPDGGSSVIRNCYLYNGATHNLGLIEGSSNSVVLVEDVQAEQASPWTGQTLFVSYATTGTGLRHTYRRCSSVKNAGLPGSMAGQVLTVQPGMYNHNTGVGTQFASITLEDCSFPGMGINGSGTGVTAGGYQIVGTRFGMGKLYTDTTLNRCYIDRSMVSPGDTSSTIRMTNCLFRPTITPTNGGDGTFQAQGVMSFDGCTFDLRAIPAFAAGFMFRWSTLTFTMINSIFLANSGFAVSGADNISPTHGLRNTDTVVCDRNVLYLGGSNKNTANYYNDGATTANRSFAQWQALGQDTHSISTNPLLNADYTPTASSPARNLTVTSLTSDYIGDITPRVTSGAYEYRP